MQAYRNGTLDTTGVTVEPTPTRRAVIDVGRECRLNCGFCYHRFADKTGYRQIDTLRGEIKAAADRGNTHLDFTGGEPLGLMALPSLVEYAMSQYGMISRIITAGYGGSRARARLTDCGRYVEWMLSIHGPSDIHDHAVGQKGAFASQSRFSARIPRDHAVDVNCVLTPTTQRWVPELAVELLRLRTPRIVNFINFNPHGPWIGRTEARGLVVNLGNPKMSEWLARAVRLLEAAGVGVNVRYYPMCRIAPEYRRCVCNDLHVTFDSGEWDYAGKPKTFARYREWGIEQSLAIEEKGEPCCRCGLQWICGGANREWHKVATSMYGEVLTPQERPAGVEADDFYSYRRHNVAGFAT